MTTQSAPAGFDFSTRSKFVSVKTDTRTSGGQTRADIPQTGILGRIWATVRGTINVVTSGPNALGQCAIINRIRLLTSASIDLVNVIGPDYFHLLRPYLDLPGDPLPLSSAFTVIASAGLVNLDFVLPVQMNLRDQIGLFPMQNRQTLVTLVVDWETDANIATGGITWTTQPVIEVWMELFTVPQDARNMPKLGTAHTLNSDSFVQSGAGIYSYPWPLGNSYLQVIHGVGHAAGANGADSWSRYQLRANQSDFLFDVDRAAFFDAYVGVHRLQSRRAGIIPIDLIGQSGLGVYDIARDTINSKDLTDLFSLITTTGALTVNTVRREVVPIARAA